MSVSQKELKKSRDLVAKLLKVDGQTYNDWLQHHHAQYIEENQDVILKALNAFAGSRTAENSHDLKDDAKELEEAEERLSKKNTL